MLNNKNNQEVALDLLKFGCWHMDLEKPHVFYSSPSNFNMLGEEQTEGNEFNFGVFNSRIICPPSKKEKKLQDILVQAISNQDTHFECTYSYQKSKYKEVIRIKTICDIAYVNGIAKTVFGINQNITEEQVATTSLDKTKEKPKRVESNLINLFDSSLDAIMVVDSTTYKYISINKAARKMYNIPDELDISKIHVLSFSQEYQEDGTISKDKAVEISKKALKLGGLEVDWAAKRYDGTNLYTQLSISPAIFEGKNVVAVIARDITYRKKSEKQANLISKLMSDLIVNKSFEDKIQLVTNAIISIFDVDFARLWHVVDNKSYDKVLGGKNGEEVHIQCHQSDPKINKYNSIAVDTLGNTILGKVKPFFTNDIKHDNRVIPNIESNDCFFKSYAIQLVTNVNGEIVGAIDIFGENKLRETDSHRLLNISNVIGQIISEASSQNELFRMREELEELYSKSDTALELSNAGYWTIYFNDPQYYISSKRTCDILGEEYKKDFKFNLETEWFTRLYEADPETAERALQEFQDSQVPGAPMFNSVYKYKRPADGRLIWTKAIGSIIRHKDGTPKIMNGVSVDITEQVEFQEELKRAKQQAEAATKAKSSFLANMSHEIRTPMNAIIGLTRLLEATDLTSSQRNYVVKTKSSANNLLGIINDILDFSKIEAGKLDIENIEFSLDEVIDELSSLMSIKAFEKDIELVFFKNYKLKRAVYGDPLRLEQVLINLISNAIKFTSEGQVLVFIEDVSVNNSSIRLDFIVKDTGIGMTDEQVGNLFQAFSQADSSTTRRFGGTGLGLSIANNLLQKMGGLIEVESDYGVGSVFKFTLDFKLGKANTQSPELIIPDSLDKIKVLIVDDNEAALKVMSAYLDDFGVNHELVLSGQQAIDIIDDSFDLILMDWKMPDLSGVDTWLKIKQKIDTSPNIVLVATYGNPEIIDEVELLGINYILMKPVTQFSLYNAIMDAFGARTVIDINERNRSSLPDLELILGARILVGEDNEINKQVIQETLEREGFFVTVTENGQEVCDEYERNPNYDVILMDLQMPIMSGYDACAYLREKGYNDIPIIALSADAMVTVKEKVKAVGMNAYVSKPINLKELFLALLNHIELKEREVNAVTERPTNNKLLKQKLLRFNVSVGLSRLGNNSDSYIGLLKKYLLNYKHAPEMIHDLIVNKSFDGARFEVHTLKGVTGNIAAFKTNEIVKRLEDALVNHDSDDVFESLVYKLTEGMHKDFDEIGKIIEFQSKDNLDDPVLDSEELIQKLNELTPEIDNSNVVAKKMFTTLKPSLQFHNVKGINQLEESLSNYDFESAFEIVVHMLKYMKGE
ncbi:MULTISPECIES: response regulator [Pseudoalteromonas]|uniref:response regulator n=1 Tax=Pseudoalteromonas TaxID=53246 RepID=UPI0015827096|nr:MULTISPECIES: response regulator [Pseudoalteromonas]MDI4653343.1 response regulator [Pseudoalteromonas shioyasakiensis]NUJ39718.1 response regulator [Pseudoalteromonas sp. 0303]